MKMEEKEQGNEAFKNGLFDEAISIYTRGIEKTFGLMAKVQREGLGASKENVEIMDLLPTLYGNRSACFHKLGKFQEALDDADQAISIKPDWVKAYHRKAQALMSMDKLDQARDAYSLALDANPEDKWLKKQVAELDEKTGHQSAHAKIENYIATHGSVKGCPTKLTLSMFEIETMLGEGNYSEVHRAVFRKTGEVFAIKSVQKDKANRMARRHPNLHNELKMERQLLLKLSHPNVIKLHFTMQDVRSIYYVTELAEGGELWAKMRFGRECLVSLLPSEVMFYMAQMVNALEYLAVSGVVHRDVKPENMMLFPDPTTNGRRETLKLIDFGTAYEVGSDLNGPKFVGTPEYMSPEAIEAKADPTPALDIWALGCSLFQLSSGRIPFKGSSPYLTFLKVKAMNYTIPDYFPSDLRDIVQRIFQKEPAERLGASDNFASLKAHPYFQDHIDFSQLLSDPIKPVPTLFELAARKAVEVFSGPTPALGEPVNRPKKKKMPAWAHQVGHFSEKRVGPRIRNTLMGLMEQRLLLGDPDVFQLFFDSVPESRFTRVVNHSLIGMSEAEQGKFRDPFIICHIGSMQDATCENVEKVVRRLNTLQPSPRLVIFGGKIFANPMDIEKKKIAMCYLSNQIPMVCCYDGSQEFKQHFSDQTYFSFFAGGVYIIVIDSFLLVRQEQEPDDIHVKAHTEWLDQEILRGKLCARHVIVVSYHTWLSKETDQQQYDDSLVIPKPIAEKYHGKLLDAGTQIILTSCLTDRSLSQKLEPKQETESRMLLTNTAKLGEDLDIRIVRVQGMEIVSDKYHLDDLPRWFSLEKDEDLEEEEVQQEKLVFSDISESSSESEDEE